MEFLSHPDLQRLLALALPWAQVWLLACARVGGLFLALPHLSMRGLPLEVRGMLVLCLAGTMVWLSPWPTTQAFAAHLAGDMAQEFLLGLGVGFSVQIAISAVRMAGQIIGIEMGLSFAAVVDPLSQSESTPIASLLAALAAQLFLATGLDRVVIAAIVRSVDSLPLGQAKIVPSDLISLVRLGQPFFEQALTLALPAMGMLFATKLGLAFLSRIAPRLHIFNLSFPLTLFIGFFVLVRSLDAIGLAVAENLHWAVDLAVDVAQFGPHVR